MSNETRTEILNQYEKHIAKETSLEDMISFLNTTVSIFNCEMKKDNFPRFIRSKEFETIAKGFSGHKLVMVPRAIVSFPYEIDDFKIPCFTKKDAAFFDYLGTDFFEWKLGYTQPHVNTYFCSLGLFPNVPFLKNATVVKTEFVLPYSLDVCILVHSDFQHLGVNNKNIYGIKNHDVFTKEEIAKSHPEIDSLGTDCITVSVYTGYFYPLHMRRIFNLCAAVYNEKDATYKCYSKPMYENDSAGIGEKGVFEYTAFKDGKTYKKEMYQIPCFSTVKLTKIDENKTLHTDIVICNLMGWMDGAMNNETVNKLTLKKIAVDSLAKYETLVKEKFPLGTKVVDFKSKLENDPGQGKLTHFAYFKQHQEKEETK